MGNPEPDSPRLCSREFHPAPPRYTNEEAKPSAKETGQEKEGEKGRERKEDGRAEGSAREPGPRGTLIRNNNNYGDAPVINVAPLARYAANHGTELTIPARHLLIKSMEHDLSTVKTPLPPASRCLFETPLVPSIPSDYCQFLGATLVDILPRQEEQRFPTFGNLFGTLPIRT